MYFLSKVHEFLKINTNNNVNGGGTTKTKD